VDRRLLGGLVLTPEGLHPVCTTELGYMAKLKPEFERRGVKIIGLSVDDTGDHEAWAQDIEDTQGARPNYPIIGDDRFEMSKLYGMLPASTSGGPQAAHPRGQPDGAQRVRDRAGQEDQIDPGLPDDHRAQLR